MAEESEGTRTDEECVVHSHPVPAEELGRYGVERDADREAEIARYVEREAPSDPVRHVELVKTEVVVGIPHEVWDVTTQEDRYWVITNLTNLYSQQYFPSLDYTLSFHVGLMMRIRSRPSGATSDDPTPFDDVFRRQEQAKLRYDQAVEAEDFQAIGMHLRECLLSLVGAARRRVAVTNSAEFPKDADFIGWIELLADGICKGRSNKKLRKYIKGTATDTWQLVSWLTHARNATEAAASIAIHGTDTMVGHFVQLVERSQAEAIESCPLCKSRKVRSHYDPFIEPDGDYYATCASCSWSNHPGNGHSPLDRQADDT